MPLHLDGHRMTAVFDQPRAWDIRFVDGLLKRSPADTPDLFTLRILDGDAPAPPARAVVIDHTVGATYGDRFSALFARYGIEPVWLPIAGGEPNKTIEPVLALAERILALNLDRRAQPIIAIGGGVVSDIAGFLAGTLLRGLPLIRIPTTLVGQADAGIAGKTGVNFAGKKNALGTYDPAALTLIDHTLLESLPPRHIANGLAEIAKAALMDHPGLWQRLASDGANLLTSSMQHPSGRLALREAVKVMLGELSSNLREHRLQRTMDFGHALTPTFEMLTQDDTLHGEWVAADMAVFVTISYRRGRISRALRDDISRVLRGLGLDLWHPLLNRTDLLAKALASTARHRGGRQHLPLLHDIGRPTFVHDVTVAELRGACDDLRRA